MKVIHNIISSVIEVSMRSKEKEAFGNGGHNRGWSLRDRQHLKNKCWGVWERIEELVSGRDTKPVKLMIHSRLTPPVSGRRQTRKELGMPWQRADSGRWETQKVSCVHVCMFQCSLNMVPQTPTSDSSGRFQFFLMQNK